MAADTPLLLFGAPRLRSAAGLLDLPASAPTWLLACLGLAQGWVGREALALRFWPEARAADAQRQLRVTLHRSRQLLRQAGAEAALQAEPGRLRLDLGCDARRFDAALAAQDWATALALHSAPLLGGLAPRGLPALDAWLADQRQRCLADWRRAALQQARQLQQADRAEEAQGLLLQQLQHDPLAEEVLQALLALAPASGDRLGALAWFERFGERAQAEWGVPPLPATQALAQALRQARPAPAAPPPPASSAGLPSLLRRPPLVGRDAELAALQARSAPLQVITGEAGVGKSRLAAAACPGALRLSARSDWQQMPLQALAAALQDEGPTLQRLDLPAAQRQVLARWLPALAPGQTLPPVTAGEPGLVEAAAVLLARWPTPVWLDDLPWLDTDSWQVVSMALAAGASGWVATWRSGDVADSRQRALDDWLAGGLAACLPLAPLRPAAVAELVQALAGRKLPSFAGWLADRSGGNPMLALESLAVLFDDGRLDVGRADWAEALVDWPQDAGASVPPRLAAVLWRRIDRLAPATQRVLGLAAVAGDASALDLLAGLADLTPWATAQGLAEAQAAGLLTGRRFAHGLVRELLLQQLPEPQRAVLHAGIARGLQAVLPPHALAAHWWAAGDTAQALDATLRAVEQDADKGLYEAGLRLLAATAERLGDAPPALDIARLHVRRAYLARQLDRLDEAQAWADTALAALPHPATRQAALVECFELALLRGRLAEAQQWLAQAREIDPDLPTLALDGAKLAHAQGDAETCARLTADHVRWLRRQRPGAELSGALTSQGVALDMQGDHAAALPLHEEALAIARQIGARHAEVEAANNLVVCLGELGRDAEAVDRGLPVLAYGDPYPILPLATNVAYSLLALGRLDEAEHWYRRVAAGGHASTACAATGKLLEISARRGADPQALGAAVDRVFDALARTEMYSVQAGALVAVLRFGRAEDAERVLPWLRAEALYPGLQGRLDEALHARGLLARRSQKRC